MLVSGSLEANLVYALAWLGFGCGHSLLAGTWSKQRLRPFLGAFYRVAYNAFATVHLVLIWSFGHWIFDDQIPFDFPIKLQRSLFVLYIFGWLIMLLGLRGYDLGRLVGIRQVRDQLSGIEGTEDEPLRLDGLHRYVRHPLYSGAFLILWGRATTELELATAIWASMYLVIGSWFEERRLLRLYGAEYERYRSRVPAFVPWKGRVC